MELQPRNNPLNEDAALLKLYAVGGGPDGPKLRIGEGDHVTMVLSARWMSTAPSPPKERVAPMAKNMRKRSLDQLVGAGEQRRRHSNAKRLGGFHIDG
jgi:hypothetical protein